MRSPLLSLYAATMAFATTEALVRIVAPPYLQMLGVPVDLLGALISLFAASALVSRLPAGLLYRTDRARWLLRASLLLTAAGSVLYPVSSHLAVLTLARVLGGLGFGVASTTALAAIMELAPPGSSHRPVATYSTVLVIGYGTGLAFGGSIADLAGYNATFWAAGGIALLGALCVPHIPTKSGRREPADRPRPTSQASRWRGLLHPSAAGVVLTAFVLNYLLSTSTTFFPLYAVAVGLSLTQISGIVSMHSLCQIVARPLSGEVTRRLGHRSVVNVGIVLLVVAYVLIPSFTAFAPLAALCVTVGVLRAASVVANTITLAEDVPEQQMSRGAASSLYNGAKDLGDVAGPLMSGVVAAHVGLGPLFLVVPPAMLAVYAVALLGLRRLKQRTLAQAEQSA